MHEVLSSLSVLSRCTLDRGHYIPTGQDNAFLTHLDPRWKTRSLCSQDHVA